MDIKFNITEKNRDEVIYVFINDTHAFTAIAEIDRIVIDSVENDFIFTFEEEIIIDDKTGLGHHLLDNLSNTDIVKMFVDKVYSEEQEYEYSFD